MTTPLIVRRSRQQNRVVGCKASVCRPESKHRACHNCGALTCDRTFGIDPDNLRRRYFPTCRDEALGHVATHPSQAELRRRRTEHDWERATDPINDSRIEGGVLPEQIPSEVRAALRAFHDSGDETAVVIGVSVGTISASLSALGLDGIYAETRSGQTVLRKAVA